MNLPRRKFLILAAAAVALPALPRIAIAQNKYPSRPIRLIVGFPAGSTSDITARLFANGASSFLGQPIVVENKPGATGSIAANYVARATNDGYTLYLTAAGTLTNGIISPTQHIDMSKDFAPIALLADGPLIVVTSPESNLHSIANLIAHAKSKPGQVLYGISGVGSVPHLTMELFAQRAGIKMTAVPYPGSPQTINDLIAGRITMSFITASTVIGLIAAGKLTALATTVKRRISVLPNVPTMTEAGMPNLESGLWLGLVAPAGTPQPLIEKLAAAAHTAIHRPEAVETLSKLGYVPLDSGPDEFGSFLRSETVRWSEVARAAGLKS